MRALLLAALLVLPVVSGCLGATTAPPTLALSGVPEGAKVEPVAEGLRLVWDAAKMPFVQNFTVPKGATMVRAHAIVGEGQTVSLVMRNAETNRRRCQTPSSASWLTPRAGDMDCIALTAVDTLPATWKVIAGSAAGSGKIQVDILTTPIDGPAAALDLSKLSQRTFQLGKTEILQVPSFDGTLLHVEVTRPVGDAKVPTVIVSSPYTNDERKLGLRPSDDVILDWGARGYAIVVADVRGYGESQGCVEVWSANEQKDQKLLVDWVAKQPWSDGNVGFYGQSYVATTPVEAAVQAPGALKAIIAVAPVINAYDDWHFGGVPNGEDLDSPLEYQSIGMHSEVFSTPPPLTQDGVVRAGNGFCDPTLEARANDPRGVYDAFYVERNFSARAKDVKAAVLYTQGFEDTNVKSMMASWWFNALPGPKLGLFGHWIHQHPPRADQETLFLAWFDQYLKGKDMGLSKLPTADIITNAGTHRTSATWPIADANDTRLALDLTSGTLGEKGAGEGTLLLVPTDGHSGNVLPVPAVDLPVDALPTSLTLKTTLTTPVEMAGLAHLDLAASVQGGDNAYVAAFLYDRNGSAERLVTFGMYNLAHRDGHERYAPLAPGEVARVSLPLLPTDHVFAAGHEMVLVLRAARMGDWDAVKPGEPGRLTVSGAGTTLVLPTVDAASAMPTGPALTWTRG